ncbi:hypothetical protein MIND_00783300 [Mycena indigotica]|uniref:Uncharacterized protein n=1 Tax=Mycena indigotica TaxID=2126181 RepID=A0A8H6SMQ5_9AGAR|nr:uncharacterized protein MIND_00783300 [Mycena indigotica]KAF7302164.1 hypothetical protein MIND_00783300 [Mycena indigotica]
MQPDPSLPKLIPLIRPNLPTGAYRSPSPSRRTNVAMIYARPSYSAFKQINSADEARRRAELVTPELDDAASPSGLTPPTPTPVRFPSQQSRLLDPDSPMDDHEDSEEDQVEKMEAKLEDDFVENNTLLPANLHPDLTMVDALAYTNLEPALEDPAVNDALDKLFNTPAFYEAAGFPLPSHFPHNSSTIEDPAELVLLPEEAPDVLSYAKDLVLYMNDQAINDEHLVPGGGARLADNTVFQQTFLTALMESSAPTMTSEMLSVNSNNRGSFDSDIIPVFSVPSAEIEEPTNVKCSNTNVFGDSASTASDTLAANQYQDLVMDITNEPATPEASVDGPENDRPLHQVSNHGEAHSQSTSLSHPDKIETLSPQDYTLCSQNYLKFSDQPIPAPTRFPPSPNRLVNCRSPLDEDGKPEDAEFEPAFSLPAADNPILTVNLASLLNDPEVTDGLNAVIDNLQLHNALNLPLDASTIDNIAPDLVSLPEEAPHVDYSESIIEYLNNQSISDENQMVTAALMNSSNTIDGQAVNSKTHGSLPADSVLPKLSAQDETQTGTAIVNSIEELVGPQGTDDTLSANRHADFAFDISNTVANEPNEESNVSHISGDGVENNGVSKKVFQLGDASLWSRDFGLNGQVQNDAGKRKVTRQVVL